MAVHSDDIEDEMTPYYQDRLVTLYCGDCLDFLPSISGIAFVLTDPPFGVQWRSNRRKVRHDHIKNDNGLAWIPDVYSAIYSSLLPDALVFSFYGWPDADLFVGEWKRIGFGLKSHFVWVKGNIGLGWFSRGQHEVAYLLTKGSPLRPQLAISDVLFADTTGNDLHPTEKPPNLCRKIINSFAKLDDLILDPFMGSGTTLIAAKQLGRHAIGIEIEEKYCEIAAKRLDTPSLFDDVPFPKQEPEEPENLFAA